ncbi:hypothetical protein KKF04_00550, partial [Patescibacteria group bacterium]|nr:hypothetical protein [Patescibacteria group bacterium]
STYGQVCNWENNIDVQVENEAPHLHFETNDKNTNAVLTEPLVGKERYTNLVDLREKYKEYYSTTLMYDPTNHWAKYRGKVPYSLVYSPSAIHSFSPLIVQAGEEQIFTIKGESLTDDLAVTLPGCSNMNWLKKEPDEQQFSCNMSSITGMKSGFIRFSSGSKPDFNFQVEIISGDKTPEPMIAKAEAVNPLADKTTQFIVEGENIPGDLEFDLPLCSNLSYAKITPSYREFSCRLPHTVKGENRKRVNGMYTFNTNFTSESASYSYPLSFTVDYGVRVNNMEPVMAIGGTKTVFTFTGKSLNLAKAIWIEKCDNFREIDRSDEMIKVSCTPQNPYKPWHLFVPDFLQKDFYRVLIKDEPGGTTLFDSQILIFSDDTVEDILEDEVFEITDQGGDLDEYNLNPEDLDNLVKSNCTLYTNIFDASMFVQNKSSFTHKNKLLPLVNLGYKKEKDSIAFFVKKTNSSFFNAVNPGATTDSYKSLISQFGLKEVGINVNGYDVTYNISTKEMESMLNQGYCFISLIENNYDTSHAGYHEGMGGVENYFNSVK